MTKSVLIAYGTRFGSTEEISNKFVEIMRSQGLDTTLINVKTDKWPPVAQFDAILIDSAPLENFIGNPLRYSTQAVSQRLKKKSRSA